MCLLSKVIFCTRDVENVCMSMSSQWSSWRTLSTFVNFSSSVSCNMSMCCCRNQFLRQFAYICKIASVSDCASVRLCRCILLYLRSPVRLCQCQIVPVYFICQITCKIVQQFSQQHPLSIPRLWRTVQSATIAIFRSPILSNHCIVSDFTRHQKQKQKMFMFWVINERSISPYSKIIDQRSISPY